MKNNSFDKEVYLERKKIQKNSNLKYEEIQIDLNEDTILKLKEVAKENEISLNDLICDILFSNIIKGQELPSDINSCIDSAYFNVHMDEILDSKKDYLMVDTNDIKKKCILITNPNKINFIEENGTKKEK